MSESNTNFSDLFESAIDEFEETVSSYNELTGLQKTTHTKDITLADWNNIIIVLQNTLAYLTGMRALVASLRPLSKQFEDDMSDIKQDVEDFVNTFKTEVGSITNLVNFRGVYNTTKENVLEVINAIPNPELGDYAIALHDKSVRVYAANPTSGIPMWVKLHDVLYGDVSRLINAAGLNIRLANYVSDPNKRSNAQDGDFYVENESLFVRQSDVWTEISKTKLDEYGTNLTTLRTDLDKLAIDVGNVSNIMNFRGVINSFDEIETPQNGDVCILGAYEYVYSEELRSWQEFGIGTANEALIVALQNAVQNLIEDVEAVQNTLSEHTQTIADIQTGLNNEIDTRTAQFEELQTALSNESNTRTEAITALQTQIDAKFGSGLNARVSRNEKRITMLEQNIPAEDFLIDNASAYSKNLETDVLEYASVSKIVGHTVVNLLPIPSKTQANDNNCSLVNLGDGSFHLNIAQFARPDADAYVRMSLGIPNLAEGSYTLSGMPGAWSTVGGYKNDTVQYNGYVTVEYFDDTWMPATKTYYATDNVHGQIVFDVPMPGMLVDITFGIRIRKEFGATLETPIQNKLMKLMLTPSGQISDSFFWTPSGVTHAKVSKLTLRGVNLAKTRTDKSHFELDANGDGSTDYVIDINSNGSITVTADYATTDYTFRLYTTPFYLPNGVYYVSGLNEKCTFMFQGYGREYYQTVLHSTTNGIELPEGYYIGYIKLRKDTGYYAETYNIMVNTLSSNEPFQAYVEKTIDIASSILNDPLYGQGNPSDTTVGNYIDWDSLKFVKTGEFKNNTGVWVNFLEPIVEDVSDSLLADNLVSTEEFKNIIFTQAYPVPVQSDIVYQLKESSE